MIICAKFGGLFWREAAIFAPQFCRLAASDLSLQRQKITYFWRNAVSAVFACGGSRRSLRRLRPGFRA
jgi:hypothetical protein